MMPAATVDALLFHITMTIFRKIVDLSHRERGKNCFDVPQLVTYRQPERVGIDNNSKLKICTTKC